MCFCVFFRGLYRVPGPTSAWTRFAWSRCKGQAVFIWLGTIFVHDRPVAPAYPMAGSRALHQVMRPVMGLGGGSRPHNPGGGVLPVRHPQSGLGWMRILLKPYNSRSGCSGDIQHPNGNNLIQPLFLRNPGSECLLISLLGSIRGRCAPFRRGVLGSHACVDLKDDRKVKVKKA